jgi:hypothetical protein
MSVSLIESCVNLTVWKVFHLNRRSFLSSILSVSISPSEPLLLRLLLGALGVVKPRFGFISDGTDPFFQEAPSTGPLGILLFLAAAPYMLFSYFNLSSILFMNKEIIKVRISSKTL